MYLNPFYVLNASLTDNREKIISLYEEKISHLDSSIVDNDSSFLDELQNICNNALNTLLNPQKRIAAEMHWFPDCDNDTIYDDIISKIYYNTTLVENYPFNISLFSNKYCPLSEICIYTSFLEYSFGEQLLSYTHHYLQNEKDIILEVILKISTLFQQLNSEQIRILLNEKRAISGFPQIDNKTIIEDVIKEMRLEIQKTVSKYLYGFGDKNIKDGSYTTFVTRIANTYSSSKYKDHAIIEDILTDYELKLNDLLIKKSDSIIRFSGYLANGADKIKINTALTDLFKYLNEWKKIVQPLQLVSLTNGTFRRKNEEVFHKLRTLAITIHNAYGFSHYSLKIITKMKEIFAEMQEKIALLDEDEKKLKELLSKTKKTVSSPSSVPVKHFCRFCAQEIPGDSVYCQYCGKKI